MNTYHLRVGKISNTFAVSIAEPTPNMPFIKSDGGRASSRRPRQKSDCTVIALALAAEINYDEAYDFLAGGGRRCSRGFENWSRFMNRQTTIFGCSITRHPFPAEKGMPRMNGLIFVERYPRGNFIVSLAGHVAAVKRRLYDLGRFTANKRWGMSIHRAETLMQISGQTILRYIKHGAIPSFRGSKNIYLNPADLMVIQEFDWASSEINPELEREVRRAHQSRLLKILKYREKWRDYEPYKFETGKIYQGIIKNPRKSALLENTPLPPNNLKSGDYVKVVERFKQVADGRIGIIKNIHYSWQQVKRRDGTRRSCWMGTVDFPKIKGFTRDDDRRIRYGIPLDCLALTDKPEVEKPPLKQTPEAVRGRKRFKVHTARAQMRLQEIKTELT